MIGFLYLFREGNPKYLISKNLVSKKDVSILPNYYWGSESFPNLGHKLIYMNAFSSSNQSQITDGNSDASIYYAPNFIETLNTFIKLREFYPLLSRILNLSTSRYRLHFTNAKMTKI